MKTIILAGVVMVAAWGCNSSKSEIPLTKIYTHGGALFTPLKEAERAEYQRQIESVLQSSLLRTSFQGGILVAKNGTVIYEKYVGSKQPKTTDSITAETPFQIASTSKPMTAAAILKLVQEGQLSLDEQLTSIFPGFPYAGVTVKTLLNHRSGLLEYLYYMEKGGWNRKQLATNTDVLNTLIGWKPPRAANPDRRFQYTNTNYVLLALIVEKISGLTFPEYMKQNFFEPLGMNNTFVHGVNNPDPVLMSYQPNGGMWALDFSDGPYGDKNIYSTPRDLLKWDQAMYGTSVLRQEMIDSAYTPYSNERPGIHNYGLGWRMLLYPSGKKVIYHNGHWHGFNSAFSRLIDEKATIIILTNKYNQSVYITAKKLYDVFANYDGKTED